MPEFSKDAMRGRELIRLSEVDVGRDIFDVSFYQLSDSSIYPIEFSMDIKNWTESDMKVNLNFTDSLTVSRGQFRDRIIIKVKNPNWF